MRIAFGCAFLFPGVAWAQTVTENAFVAATVNQGLLTIYNGNYHSSGNNNENLTYTSQSFLTVEVNGLYYTNNGNLIDTLAWGVHIPLSSKVIQLVGDQTRKVKDTITTVWKESGFDIVQKVYPVAFSASGVIVLSISIVNHSGLALPAQAQYLLDNMNSSIGAHDSANDNPFLLHRYGIIRSYQDCPPNPIPSFYMAFEYPLTSPYLGTVGVGYVNDS